ncbi:hypothetical protein BV22DRAFT_1047640 [Leucogyrophana mollusca]|uniref:Uncharacterized protein n=1 Tax=Leucogyrophana mollusca TaxID=85980 RepID=A0ACB8BEE6_9AGAM|nr:hypothetical protein BV22DRAFT_1047640 [Leucogyrophana mollusca]
MNSISTTTLLSTTSTCVPAQKDYASAFSQLQSTYGACGQYPNPVPRSDTSSWKKWQRRVRASSRSTLREEPSTPSPSPPSTTCQKGQKDYASAFAHLQSTYGACGQYPSPVSHSEGFNWKKWRSGHYKVLR